MNEENMLVKDSTEIKKIEVDNETKYPVQNFIDNAEALGYNEVIVSGALFSYKEKELTKSKFIEIVKSFLRKKVE